jgi:8-oxo-dGTP pyrophosphatase MutT (NUDIX family)
LNEVTKYTCGAMFSEDLTKVAMIRKNRPAWMAGKLNFIGGHVEDGESFVETQVREFWEETGVQTTHEQWKHFATLRSVHSLIAFFATIGDLAQLRTTTDEEVVVVSEGEVWDMVPNIVWLLPMAIDKLKETGVRVEQAA